MSRPAENTRAGLPRAMNTTSLPSSTASEEISCAVARDAVEHRLQHGDHLVRAQDRMPPSVSTCGVSVNSLPSLATKAAALEGEEDAARGGARQVGGAGEIAQRHRAAGGCRTSAAGAGRGRGFRRNRSRALLAAFAFQLRHGCVHLAPSSRPKLRLPSTAKTHVSNSPIRSIGEQIHPLRKDAPP